MTLAVAFLGATQTEGRKEEECPFTGTTAGGRRHTASSPAASQATRSSQRPLTASVYHDM